MAVKFSQFTTGSALSDISYIVGYKGSDNIQIAPSLITGTTYTIDVPSATKDINLAGSDGTNDAITLTDGAGITITRTSASELTFEAAGDTYTLQAGAKAGSSVPLELDASAGSDSSVSLTEGTGITLTQTSASEITIASAAGVTMTKDQFTGDNTTVDFTLSVTPSGTDNLNIFISGVYQNSLDSSGVANYSIVAGTTLRFATAPPTTAANGIEVVITE
jgi:choline dehydrogenase-like flavoprotein